MSRGWSKNRLALLPLLPFVLLRAGTFAEPDTFWEIRTGTLLTSTHRLPTTDPFSWTVHGQPWTLNSWGFDLAASVAYRIAGLAGVALLCAGIVLAVFAVALVLAERLGASPFVTGAVLFGTLPLLTAFLSARPQLLDYLAVLVLVLLLHDLVDGRLSPGRFLPAVLLLSVLWVNLHAGALLGVAMIGATGVLLVVRRSAAARWCLAGVPVALAGSFANPYGIDVISQTLHVRKEAVDAGFLEWHSIDLLNPLQLIPLALGLLALGVAVQRRSAPFIATLAITALGSFAAIRFLPLLALTAAPVLAAWASEGRVGAYVQSRQRMLSQGAAVAIAALVAVAIPATAHLGRPDPHGFSEEVVRAIPAGCRAFTSPKLGGFVELRRPDVLVSLDNRIDLFGASRYLRYEEVLDGRPDSRGLLNGAGCALVSPSSGLAERLTTDPAWQLEKQDGAAALFVRG